MQCIGIFYFNDKNGIVDIYIEYLLSDIMKNTNHMCIISNDKLTQSGKDILLKYTDDIYISKNMDFDCNAYKDVLKNHIGFENLKKWDELILCNDSFYGPIYPFENVFLDMNTRNCDFWGLLNIGYNSDYNIKQHILTDILVIRKNMLQSDNFVDFWNNLIRCSSQKERAFNFEEKFTTFFLDCGFVAESFLDFTGYEKGNHLKHIDWSKDKIVKLITDYKYPLIRKDVILNNFFVGSSGKNILEVIKNKSDYDTDMIWKNLARNHNPKVLYEKMGLHYVLSDTMSNPIKSTEKVAVFIHMYYEDLIDECISYIVDIPDYIDIYISTSNSITHNILKTKLSNKKNIEEIILLPNRGRDIASLLVGMKQYISKYDIFCFVHDKKSHKGNNVLGGDLYRQNLWDNTIKNKSYIENILSLFYNNKNFGIIAVPYRFLNDSIKYKNRWDGMCEYTKHVASMIGINANYIDADYAPLFYGTAFWCRKKALSQLFDYPFKLEDFQGEPMGLNGTISHAIERIFTFVAQHNNYISVVAENIHFAEDKAVHVNKIIASLPYMNQIDEYMKKFDSCYIYGCGFYSREITIYLDDIGVDLKGYIVSNAIVPRFRGRTVYSLYEVQDLDKYGIILALGNWYTDEIEQVLRGKGFEHYLRLEIE